MMSKVIKGVIGLSIFLAICWGGMVITDYQRCKQVKPPIFARPANVLDYDVYIGLGYTITIGFNGPVGAAGEELKGHFSWGWDVI